MRTLRAILCLAMTVSAACGTSDRGRAGSPTMEAGIESLLSDYDGADRPGACVLVRHKGEARFERCFGMADLELGRPADPRTNFRLASLTKQFTAMAVLRLEEAGSLSLDARLTDVFPDFPEYGRRIRIRHLLTHTSGLIDYESLLPETQTEQVKDSDVLRMLAEQDSTYFEPGSRFRYSNSGYAVLARVIEEVSGVRFAEYLSREIFRPLGMAHTVAHEEGVSTVTRRAFGYSRAGNGWVRTDQSLTSAVLGDGGIYTSLEDLGRWYGVVEGRATLVSAESLRRAFEPTRSNDGEPVGYGLGWRLDEYQGRRRYYHEGSTRGFRNGVERFPQEDVTVVFLSNRNDGDIALVDSIADMALDELASAG